MAREFDRNIFVMLLAIMLGIIIITYFVADIVNRSKIETLTTEMTTIKEKGENFTSYFLKSSILLDQAREDRASGNYHFDLAFLWYDSALSEKNGSTMELYKTRGIDNCTESMPYYINSHDNFEEAGEYFNETKNYTTYQKYLDILNIYINLTDSGSNLSMLRCNASVYLMYLTENLTFVDNNVTYLENVSELLTLLNTTLDSYNRELEEYNGYQKELDEYEFFDEIR